MPERYQVNDGRNGGEPDAPRPAKKYRRGKDGETSVSPGGHFAIREEKICQNNGKYAELQRAESHPMAFETSNAPAEIRQIKILPGLFRVFVLQ